MHIASSSCTPELPAHDACVAASRIPMETVDHVANFVVERRT